MTQPRVAVLTATIPSRAKVVEEARASVAVQETHAEVEHRVWLNDDPELGPADCLNAMRDEIVAAGIPFDYCMVLDDDDVLKPNHIETCVTALEKSGADIASPWCDTAGFSGKAAVAPFMNYNRPRKQEDIFKLSCISHTSLFKANWLKVAEWEGTAFDWTWWKFMVKNGAKWVQVEESTWVYRLMGGNLSHGEDPWKVEL